MNYLVPGTRCETSRTTQQHPSTYLRVYFRIHRCDYSLECGTEQNNRSPSKIRCKLLTRRSLVPVDAGKQPSAAIVPSYPCACQLLVHPICSFGRALKETSRIASATPTHLLSRDMSSLMRSRTGTSMGTLIGVSPGSPGKGKFTVIVPPATLSFVVVITSDGRGRDMNPRTPCARWGVAGAPFGRLCCNEHVGKAPSLQQPEKRRGNGWASLRVPRP